MWAVKWRIFFLPISGQKIPDVHVPHLRLQVKPAGGIQTNFITISRSWINLFTSLTLPHTYKFLYVYKNTDVFADWFVGTQTTRRPSSVINFTWSLLLHTCLCLHVYRLVLPTDAVGTWSVYHALNTCIVSGVFRVYYLPQRSCGKVMFSQASVILFTGGGGVADTTPRQTPPSPWVDTPLARDPLGRHPPGQTPPG